jgi:hypothetical protein
MVAVDDDAPETVVAGEDTSHPAKSTTPIVNRLNTRMLANNKHSHCQADSLIYDSRHYTP